jgi:hypothetical protein
LTLLAGIPVFAQPKSDLAANAAMKYWQAFAQLPPRDEATQQRLRDWPTTPLDVAARKLVADSEASFRYLRRGAALPHCDWSLDYEDGIGLLLPHLDKARTLTLLACLKARIDGKDGHPADGLDDLLATMLMGRQVADPIMVCLLVDHNIEANAGEAIGLLLTKLDADALKRVADRLNAFPPAATIEQTLTTERDYFTAWSIRKLQEWERAGVKDFRAKLRPWFQGSSGDEAIMALVDDDSAGRLIKALEGLGPFFDEQKRLAGLSRSQFLTEWPALQKKQASDPVATVMLPAIVKVIDARDRSRARLSLLQAAVDVARHGRDALANHRDPFGAGPFEFVARPQGFELRSALQIDGKPVTLVAGPPDANH